MPRRITWLCIADAGIAHIKKTTGLRAPIETFATIDHGPYERGNNEAPGRAYESASTARHSYVDADGPIRREKRAFAQMVADYLDEAAKRDAFHRLVIAAAPQFLGDLRAALSPAVQNRLARTLPKDLTKASDAELEARRDELFSATA